LKIRKRRDEAIKAGLRKTHDRWVISELVLIYRM
jgi:hypothetical protein